MHSFNHASSDNFTPSHFALQSFDLEEDDDQDQPHHFNEHLPGASANHRSDGSGGDTLYFKEGPYAGKQTQWKLLPQGMRENLVREMNMSTAGSSNFNSNNNNHLSASQTRGGASSNHNSCNMF